MYKLNVFKDTHQLYLIEYHILCKGNTIIFKSEEVCYILLSNIRTALQAVNIQ